MRLKLGNKWFNEIGDQYLPMKKLMVSFSYAYPGYDAEFFKKKLWENTIVKIAY